MTETGVKSRGMSFRRFRYKFGVEREGRSPGRNKDSLGLTRETPTPVGSDQSCQKLYLGWKSEEKTRKNTESRSYLS